MIYFGELTPTPALGFVFIVWGSPKPSEQKRPSEVESAWLSPDPLGEAGGLNLYGYVGGNPINTWDPLGLCWEDDLRNGLTLAGSALGTGLGFLGGGGGGALASVPDVSPENRTD
ncbi:RHS repeat-associated core domain-containing protein [Luteolibacter algae]|uniref:RHS repeat-associated core domain-containing protein n=1 Tax=Luteolibacter algae TaxID=454151 RepID=A0ABW5D9N4_9BACT